MKKLKFRKSPRAGLYLAVLMLFLFINLSCQNQKDSQSEMIPSTPATEVEKSGPSSPRTAEGEVLVTFDLNLDFSKYKVTFIELGADRCLPCRAMQPIMRELAREFKGQLQVVFYDVWKDPRPARKYGIQLIPTQVFIDQNGKEFFRHVGFFPKEELLQVLKMKGVS